LTIYVVHLVILYGSSWHRGLHVVYGPSLGLAQASLATLGVLGVSLAVALGWHELKRYADQPTRWGVRALLVLGLGRFLFFA
jgi:hypothetical protein